MFLVHPGRDDDLFAAGSAGDLLADGATRAVADLQAAGGDASVDQERDLLDGADLHRPQQGGQHVQGGHPSSTESDGNCFLDFYGSKECCIDR